jgi:hypothetical protein
MSADLIEASEDWQELPVPVRVKSMSRAVIVSPGFAMALPLM